ncbi:hypothetical protein J6590_013074 [Homalodisca vitripennis]|nr:hypothetical protein J6590_013074 [Homalodisca vitripennis]
MLTHYWPKIRQDISKYVLQLEKKWILYGVWFRPISSDFFRDLLLDINTYWL